MLFKTNKLIISKLETEQDFNDLFLIYKNPENFKFLGNTDFNWTLNNMKLKMLLYRKLYKINLGIYIARLQDTLEPVAEVSFFNSFENPSTPEIGYILEEKFWNQGIGTELVEGMITYLKNQKCEKIFSRMNKQNVASYRICEKLGFKIVSEEVMNSGITRQTLVLNLKPFKD